MKNSTLYRTFTDGFNSNSFEFGCDLTQCASVKWLTSMYTTDGTVLLSPMGTSIFHVPLMSFQNSGIHLLLLLKKCLEQLSLRNDLAISLFLTNILPFNDMKSNPLPTLTSHRFCHIYPTSLLNTKRIHHPPMSISINETSQCMIVCLILWLFSLIILTGQIISSYFRELMFCYILIIASNS